MKFLRDNGLSIVLFALFILFLIAQSLTGLPTYNEEQLQHGQAAITYWEYLMSGHFIETVFENWESEFLQMAAFVILTVVLMQKGSPESKDEVAEDVDADPRLFQNSPTAPGPVKQGGFVLWLYERSLGLTFIGLFLLSFVLHLIGGTWDYNEEQLEHGAAPVTILQYLGTSRFWFESFQNWQSEFLAVGSMVVLAIFLRQRGSPESKPVHAPHSKTGH